MVLFPRHLIPFLSGENPIGSPVRKIWGTSTRLSGYNPGTVCAPCERALFAARELSDPDGQTDLALWVWDT
jgi:hypothetical protein